MPRLINGYRLPKYIHKYMSRGNLYFYYNRNGVRVRLHGEPGSKQFEQEYLAASGGVPLSHPPAKPKSVIQRQTTTAPKIGVYLLFLEQAVVYVGASLDMPERVKAHRANGRPFDRAYFIATLPIERFVVEKALIAAFNPPQNRAGRVVNGNTAGTEILKPDQGFENRARDFLYEMPLSR